MLLSSTPRSCTSRLAWLNRTPIAVASGRINQNSFSAHFASLKGRRYTWTNVHIASISVRTNPAHGRSRRFSITGLLMLSLIPYQDIFRTGHAPFTALPTTRKIPRPGHAPCFVLAREPYARDSGLKPFLLLRPFMRPFAPLNVCLSRISILPSPDDQVHLVFKD